MRTSHRPTHPATPRRPDGRAPDPSQRQVWRGGPIDPGEVEVVIAGGYGEIQGGAKWIGANGWIRVDRSPRPTRSGFARSKNSISRVSLKPDRQIAILTTPDGANLPASAVEENFPVLVRLDKEWFVFSQAKAGGKGVSCGVNNTTLPTGSSPHTSEAWFRGEQSNATVLAWGNEAGQGKVMMQFFSPPHMMMECCFSGADVTGGTTPGATQWVHVVHAFKNDDSRIDVNGALDGVSTSDPGARRICCSERTASPPSGFARCWFWPLNQFSEKLSNT